QAMERAPKEWKTGNPWIGLALAVVFQAKQDIHRGAKTARTYLSGKSSDAERRKAVRDLVACKAQSAAAFFESPLWFAVCNLLDAETFTLPPDVVRDMDLIERVLDDIKESGDTRRKGRRPTTRAR